MDKLTHYRDEIKQFLSNYADLMNHQPVPDLETVLAFDDKRDQYMLLKVGWPRGKRIRQMLVHASIHDEKIWIEEDLTEEGIASFLLKQGMPSSDIVIGFQPPQLRPFTEFAVA